MRLLALLALVVLATPTGAAGTTHVGVPGTLPLGEVAAPLVVTFAFGQSAVRGQPDFVSIVHVVPAGNATWMGLWWASSEAGSSAPVRLAVTPQGAFVDHSTTTASVQGGLIHVRYHFLGLDGVRWDYDAPPVPVLDATPWGEAPIFGGLAADAHLVAFSPWNVMRHAAPMGFSLRAADGTLLRDELVGACADPSQPDSEAGCRIPYVLQREGSTLELWDLVDGARRIDQTVALDALAQG